MKLLFIYYPKCSTCQKAKKFLIDHQIEFEERHIVENRPTKEEILKWIEAYEIEPKKLFNTSGLVYRELGLKDRIKMMSKEEMAEILGKNGMLVKRPLLIGDKTFLIGFKEKQWEEEL